MKRHLTGLIAVTFVVLSFKSGAQQWNGLTLYSSVNSSLGYLIDTNGTAVKTWTFTGGGTGYSIHMSPGGDIWRSVLKPGNYLLGGGMTGKIQKWSYAGTLLWDYTYSSADYCLHHDHCPLPNGNVLVISYDVKSVAQATAAGSSTAIAIWSEKVMELKPVGTNSAEVVWEWKVWDHLVQDKDIALDHYASSIVDNPQLIDINYKTKKDWIHMNGIDYNPVLDQIVLSSHNLNEWYVIDHSTTTEEAASHAGGRAGKGGDILYRWGNPAAYQASGPAVLNVTHDSHWVPENCPGAGNLAGINNKGLTSPVNKTTADAITPPRVDYNYTVSTGDAFTPSLYGSRHVSTGYTSNMGSSEQFPNGNQMICLATSGMIYEIDPQGGIIWTKSTGSLTAQAHRYTQCYIDNPVPAQPTITANGTDLVSTSAASYQWYVNGNRIEGAISQTYTPIQYGIHLVRTADSSGCVYAYSAGFSPTSFTGVKHNEGSKLFKVYPNPTNGIVNIDMEAVKGEFQVSLYDQTGSLMLSGRNERSIDLSHLSRGLYFLTVKTSTQVVTKKISLIN